MQLLPAYINLFFLMLVMIIRATHSAVYTMAGEYMYVAAPMLACHNALILYADANQGVSGTVMAATVDAYLPPNITDPGSFTYVITAPGTVDTYLTSTNGLADPAAVITLVQTLSGNAITAGFVSGGQILTSSTMPEVSAAASVPNGAYVIQTTLRTH